MYQVLYRKWRPKDFDDVYGQPQVTATLRSELKNDRLSHAYLFTGTRGTGKTSCAKILARAVNCLHPVDGNPCNECEICKGIEDESITDVVEMDAASNNGVDDVRLLRDMVNFTPSVCKYRVIIVDEVHMLSTAAFNALLKTLEEPPGYVIFILATTEEHKVPATILSRCQKLNFKRIAPEDIAQRLKYIAEQENAMIDDDAAMLIARLADGGMRDAVSLLDQCLGQGQTVSEEVVTKAAGLAGTEHIFELSKLIRAADCAGLVEYIGQLHEQAKDLYRVCDELVLHFRSLMIINTVKKPESLLTVTTTELKRLTDDAGQYTLAETLEIIDSLGSVLERMARGVNRRTELEMSLIRISRKLQKAAASDVEKRIDALEKLVRSGAFLKASPDNDNKFAAPKQSPSLPQRQIEELSNRAVRYEAWPDVLAILEGDDDKGIISALAGSGAYIVDDFMLIDCNDFGADLMRRDRVKNILKSAIAQVAGRSYRLGPYRPSSDQSEISSTTELLIARLKSEGIESKD